MDVRKIVVVVEEVEAARTALEWALHNLFRYGDLITLLHVFCPSNSKSKRKTRLLRLKGYQLALSFKDICSSCFFNTNVEIIVTEGDDEGGRIAAMVRDIGAFALVVGLHDQSFLYRLAMTQSNIANNFNCKVLAIKHPTSPPLRTSVAPAATRTSSATSTPDSSTNIDFSQIEIGRLEYPEIPEPKVPYRICPDPTAIIWRRRKASRSRRNSS